MSYLIVSIPDLCTLTYFDTPSSLMFKELGWLSVESRLKYNKAVITYRPLNNLTPDYLTELLTPLSEMYSLNLRSSENGLLHIPLSRTTLCDNSFTWSASKLWNALPQTVRDSGSLVAFKKNLKHCLSLNQRDGIWFTSICYSMVFGGIQRP